MVAPVVPFIENFQLASGALREGASALFEAEAGAGEVARQGKAYAGQVIAEGFTQIKAAARRYLTTPEFTNHSPKTIIAHDAFRTAVLACADDLDKIVSFIGVPAERIAASLRAWVEESEPKLAPSIAMACDAAEKIAKRLSIRAA